MPIEVDENELLDLTVGAGVLAEQVGEILQKQASQAAELAALAPEVVDNLIENGLLAEASREKAARTLVDPVQALHFIRKLASVQAASTPAAIGAPIGETRTAAATPNVVLERRYDPDDESLASNQLFRRGLGLS